MRNSASKNIGHAQLSASPAYEFLSSRAGTSSQDDKMYRVISMALHAALPPPDAIHWMINAGLDVSFHEVMFYPYAKLFATETSWKADLADIPKKTTHPVLLARYLLILATCLQTGHPEQLAEGNMIFLEPPHRLMRRLV